jgi:hypothetical protein
MNLRTDLPIKYYLNLHTDDLLFDSHAALYSILQYLVKVSEVKGKSLDLTSLKFTTNSLKYIFGEKIKNVEFKDNLIKKIKSLIQEEYLDVQKENFIITQKAIHSFYQIND